MSDPISLLGSLIWDAWGGQPEEASQAHELGASLVASLQGMGYRIVKQERVGVWCERFGLFWPDEHPTAECDFTAWRDLP